jgi:hypothetical protein
MARFFIQNTGSDVLALGCICSLYFEMYLWYILKCQKISNEKFMSTFSHEHKVFPWNSICPLDCGEKICAKVKAFCQTFVSFYIDNKEILGFRNFFWILLIIKNMSFRWRERTWELFEFPQYISIFHESRLCHRTVDLPPSRLLPAVSAAPPRFTESSLPSTGTRPTFSTALHLPRASSSC